MIVVRLKNPGTGKQAGLVECIQDFIGEGGKRLWCIEDVAVFVTGSSRAGFSSDQVFASDIEEVRRCMQRQAARPALAQNFPTFGGRHSAEVVHGLGLRLLLTSMSRTNVRHYKPFVVPHASAVTVPIPRQHPPLVLHSRREALDTTAD